MALVSRNAFFLANLEALGKSEDDIWSTKGWKVDLMKIYIVVLCAEMHHKFQDFLLGKDLSLQFSRWSHSVIGILLQKNYIETGKIFF